MVSSGFKRNHTCEFMLNNFGGLPRSFSCLSCSIFLRNSSNPSSLFGSLRGFSSELLLHRNWQEMRWNSFNAQRHHPNTTQTMIIIVLLCSSILSFSKKNCTPTDSEIKTSAILQAQWPSLRLFVSWAVPWPFAFVEYCDVVICLYCELHQLASNWEIHIPGFHSWEP